MMLKEESSVYHETEGPREECGVFGIYFPHEDISKNIVKITLAGALANQHRGEESAGIVVGNGQRISPVFKRMGLVRNLYEAYLHPESEGDSFDRSSLEGYIAVAHNRYSTTGSSNILNAGPFSFESDLGQIAVSHNGNITNSEKLKKQLISSGYTFSSTTDSEVIGALIVSSEGITWEEKIINALPQLNGSFSLVVCTKDSLYGIRDRIGNRPLSYAQFRQDGVIGFAISSESVAFDNLGFDYKREVLPGEMIKINNSEVASSYFVESDEIAPAFCGLEVAYLERPDSRIEGIQLDTIRRSLGGSLAILYPPLDSIDFVTYIPESARSSAEGYAALSANILGRPVPCITTMIKNRYGTIDGAIRGFIHPDNTTRQRVGLENYHPLDLLIGKKVVVVDDSIIRGNTTAGVVTNIRHYVGDLRNSGAAEVHLRIIFPPVIDFCPLGTDINETDYLIARELEGNIDKIARELDVDSLGYLTPAQFQEGVNRALGYEFKLCLGCTTGDYPVETFQVDKRIFEED